MSWTLFLLRLKKLPFFFAGWFISLFVSRKALPKLTIEEHNIAVISLAVGSKYKKAVGLGIENKRRYCELHGYDFFCAEESLDSSRPISWSKILLIQKVLENPKYKWVFWSDADSIIMNPKVPLERFIDEKYNLIIAKTDEINAGQFFLKNCPWSLQLLSDIYSQTECIHHPWWEQQALILVLRKNPQLENLIKIVSPRLFNSGPSETTSSLLSYSYQPEDFMIHFAGIRSLNYLSYLFYKYNKMVVLTENLSSK